MGNSVNYVQQCFHSRVRHKIIMTQRKLFEIYIYLSASHKIVWTKSLKELIDYIENMKIELEGLDIHKIVDKNITYEFYNSNNIKKLLKFNY